jgi:two-component sensor histidine kinase
MADMHSSSDPEPPLSRSDARAAGDRVADARPVPAAPPTDLTARVTDATFLESVLNASQDCIKVLTYDGDLVFMNNGGRAVMEVEDFEALRGCPWVGFWDGEGRIEAQAALEAARAGGTGHFQGAADTAKGTPKFWDVTVTRVPGANGGRDHILSISRDITDAKRAEALRDLLAHELSHRVKNSLSVVQAIAMQTFKAGDEARLDVFNGRLKALAQAQDLLLQDAWEPVQLRDVVENSLGPICPAGRCTADGDDYALDAQRGLSLALALHELGTNAAKYGALSSPGGAVRVSWTAGDGELRLSWAESGGPPVAAPLHRGFGTRLITRNLEADFGGKVDLNYARSGLVLTLVAPA